MSVASDVWRGITAYIEAHRVIAKHGLWKYLVRPGLIALACAVVYFGFFYFFSPSPNNNPDDYWRIFRWWADVKNWYYDQYWAFVLWLYSVSFKVIVQTIVSPLLANLSETVEKLERGRDAPKINWLEFMDDVVRALRLSLRNMVYELVLGFLIILIPFGWFMPDYADSALTWLLVFGISAYYFGFGYIDYTLERKRYNLRQSVKFVRGHKALTTGLGIPIGLAMFVPIVGWVFGPTYAVTAATLETMDLLDHPEGQENPENSAENPPPPPQHPGYEAV